MSLVRYLSGLWRPKRAAGLVIEAKTFVDNHKLLMTHLARYCGVLETSPAFAGERVDPALIGFAEGKRDVFFHLMQLAGVHGDDFDALLKDMEDEMKEGDLL